jgi:glycolate oxidase FAD binding subunit
MSTTIDNFRQHVLARKPLRIRGGGSKDFYGGPLTGEVLDTRVHSGILGYEPTELVITAKCGTPLSEIKSALAKRRQFLPCELPNFGGEATVGGAVAAGLSGPRRMSAGSLRDFVLGVRIMDGSGHELKFGGEVMKNVAGYDVSRLLAGSLGTLGLILDVSIKVLPCPVAEATLQLEMPQANALEQMNRWGGQPLPISATCWEGNVLSVRLSGAEAAVRSATAELGGELVPAAQADEFWDALCQQRTVFFAGEIPLWRLSLPSVTPPLELPGATLIEWGGAQRWLRGDLGASRMHQTLEKLGGHATMFRGGVKEAGVFQPLPPALMAIHRRLKAVFDPHGVFNPGRLVTEF